MKEHVNKKLVALMLVLCLLTMPLPGSARRRLSENDVRRTAALRKAWASCWRPVGSPCPSSPARNRSLSPTPSLRSVSRATNSRSAADAPSTQQTTDPVHSRGPRSHGEIHHGQT